MREREKERTFCCWNWNMKMYNCGIFKVYLLHILWWFMGSNALWNCIHKVDILLVLMLFSSNVTNNPSIVFTLENTTTYIQLSVLSKDETTKLSILLPWIFNFSYHNHSQLKNPVHMNIILVFKWSISRSVAVNVRC